LRKKYSTGDNVELLLYGSKEIRLEGNLHIWGTNIRGSNDVQNILLKCFGI
jgi:hypothetical protein